MMRVSRAMVRSVLWLQGPEAGVLCVEHAGQVPIIVLYVGGDVVDWFGGHGASGCGVDLEARGLVELPAVAGDDEYDPRIPGLQWHHACADMHRAGLCVEIAVCVEVRGAQPHWLLACAGAFHRDDRVRCASGVRDDDGAELVAAAIARYLARVTVGFEPGELGAGSVELPVARRELDDRDDERGHGGSCRKYVEASLNTRPARIADRLALSGTVIPLIGVRGAGVLVVAVFAGCVLLRFVRFAFAHVGIVPVFGDVERGDFVIVREGSEVWLYVILWLLVIAAVAGILGGIAALVGWAVERCRHGCAKDVVWRHDGLCVDMDDWQLWDVQWRQVDGRVEVAYSVANWLPGQTRYRNDFVLVFQRGVSLEERGVHVSRVLLKGAEVRFLQVFDARDGSVPVIQRNSLDTEREESDE